MEDPLGTDLLGRERGERAIYRGVRSEEALKLHAFSWLESKIAGIFRKRQFADAVGIKSEEMC